MPSDQRGIMKRAFALPWRAKLKLIGRLLRDKQVPWYAKLIIPAVIAYLAMPLDIIPDFIPVLGQLDDMLVIVVGTVLLLRLTPAGAIAGHVAALEGQQP